MSFLAPLFLAGLAAIALPILLHLRKQRPKQNMQFSSLMFLEESTPVTKTRTKLQDIILLILRCLAIALLALAFSRPFFKENATNPFSQDTTLHYLLIDNSASMRGKPLEQAIAKAEELIKQFPDGDHIALATYSDSIHPLIHPDRARAAAITDQKSRALDSLKVIKPSWNASQLDLALIATNSATSEDTIVKIHLISDLQAGSNTQRLEEEFWAHQLQVIPHPILPLENWSNAGVHIIPSKDHTVQARVTNSPNSNQSNFQLTWQGHSTTTIHVPAGESLLVSAPKEISTEGTITLTGDDYDFDNTSTWVTPQPPLATLYSPEHQLNDNPNESAYYTSRAIQSTSDYRVDITSIMPEDPAALTITSDASKLEAILAKGGNVLFTMPDVDSASTIAALLGISSPQDQIAKEASIKDYSLFGEIDYQSSVFQPFADVRYSDFSNIHIWKYRILPQAIASKGNILASWDSGDPAWIEFSLTKAGKSSKLHILTTTWRPVDSQLARTTKFPPLLHSLLQQGVSQSTVPAYSKVGSFHQSPGIHLANSSMTSALLDPSETNITPLTTSQLKALAIPLSPPLANKTGLEQQQQLSNKELERKQGISWWLFIAAALFFALETLFSAFAPIIINKSQA